VNPCSRAVCNASPPPTASQSLVVNHGHFRHSNFGCWASAAPTTASEFYSAIPPQRPSGSARISPHMHINEGRGPALPSMCAFPVVGLPNRNPAPEMPPVWPDSLFASSHTRLSCGSFTSVRPIIARMRGRVGCGRGMRGGRNSARVPRQPSPTKVAPSSTATVVSSNPPAPTKLRAAAVLVRSGAPCLPSASAMVGLKRLEAYR
jgi:hypothetical protein